MNILFPTQSSGLRLFDALGQALASRGQVGRLGFTLADHWTYEKWRKEWPDFEDRGHVLVKEWELTAARAQKPDHARLAAYEKMLAGPSGSGPGLFGAIVADRRLIMGPDCSYSQDYRRRFDDDTLLRILQNGCEAMERLFDELKPDLVVGFVCVSLLEYLAFLFARARGIRYLNLRTSRVANRVLLADTHRDPAGEVAAAYARSAFSDADRQFANDWIDEARAVHAKYEGVIAPSARPAQGVRISGSKFTTPFRLLRTMSDYYRSGAVADNHSPSPVRASIFKGLINPVRARLMNRKLADRYVPAAELRKRRYALFPLHTEPEVSLLLYGRPYVNQIELMRALAFSLPADMVLVVKEHPWMVGKRHLSAYDKMLRIPRVRLAAPQMAVRDLLSDASLVVVHTGSTWLEAALLGKPTIGLGPTMGELLPPGMMRRCHDQTMLPEMIASLLAEARQDDAALHRLIAAIASVSAPVNLYTGLLGRTAYTPDAADGAKSDIDILADFLLVRASQPSMAAAQTFGAAAW
jgi:hypothetical protein